jgi:hypothetical protein
VVSQVLADPVGISQGRVESLCPIHNEQGVLPIWDPILLEYLCIVDVGHLPSQLSNCEFAVAVKIFQSRLVLPIVRFLLE